MIVLLPEYQNKGIGSHVLKPISGEFKIEGIYSILLYTNQNNQRAQRCYVKCGFKVTEELIQKMSNGDTVRRCKMEKVL